MRILLLLFSLLIFLSSILSAQRKTLDRLYVPIVISDFLQPPLFNLKGSEWKAFKYDALNNTWQPVPFQFDDKDKEGRYFRDDQDGIVDANDEMVVLPEDLGDKSELHQWLLDDNSKNSFRLELEYTDPLNPTNKGWLYLYRGVALSSPPADYVNYIAGPINKPAADTIKTAAFTLGHNANGWMDYLQLNGNIKDDLIDRFKLRLAGDGILVPPYEINEDFVEAASGADVVKYYQGSVRSFHTIRAAILLEKLNLPLIPDRAVFDYNYQYFPYSFYIAAETDIDAGMLAVFGVRIIRQSLDFNEKAYGMKVYSLFNDSLILIDGSMDSFNNNVDNNSAQNWIMASGDNGTILLIFDISLMKNSKRELYYRDDKNSSSTSDNTQDTGDNISYGDMGVMIKATGDALITDRLIVKYKGYFLPEKNVDAQFGKEIMLWEKNPVMLSAVEQTYNPSLVDQHYKSLPQRFKLYPAYPNPSSSRISPQIRFDFSIWDESLYTLSIYNVLGQEVKRFKNLDAHAGKYQSILWNLQDHNGEPVPVGVYFYQLFSVNGFQSQKLLICP